MEAEASKISESAVIDSPLMGVIGGDEAGLFSFTTVRTLFHLDDVSILHNFKPVTTGGKEDYVPRMQDS